MHQGVLVITFALVFVAKHINDKVLIVIFLVRHDIVHVCDHIRISSLYDTRKPKRHLEPLEEACSAVHAYPAGVGAHTNLYGT